MAVVRCQYRDVTMPVWQYGSMVVWQYGSMAVWQYGSMTVLWQYGSSTMPVCQYYAGQFSISFNNGTHIVANARAITWHTTSHSEFQSNHVSYRFPSTTTAISPVSTPCAATAAITTAKAITSQPAPNPNPNPGTDLQSKLSQKDGVNSDLSPTGRCMLVSRWHGILALQGGSRCDSRLTLTLIEGGVQGGRVDNY